MKTLRAYACLALLLYPHVQAETVGTVMSKAQVIAEGEKMADAQLAEMAAEKQKAIDRAKFTTNESVDLPANNMPPKNRPLHVDWISGVMWAGYADFTHVSSNPAYSQALQEIGEQTNWTPYTDRKNPFFADDLTVCQAFLDVYAGTKDPKILVPTQSRFDQVSDFIQTKELSRLNQSSGKPLTWWWCDALFMAPSSFARLSQLTGDPKYLNAVHTEWWRTTALLYDQEEHLFYRDKTSIPTKTKNGKKVFWSRGNGWVFAGLARLLPYIPQGDPLRPKYVGMYREMAVKLASLQRPDGTWYPSLIDPADYPDSETSGTALNCFAFAWGINNGVLDTKTYLPVTTKAWAALLAARQPNGLLGYVQGVGHSPEPVRANTSTRYGTGAFLMAATQLSKLAPITVPPAPRLAVEAPLQPLSPPLNSK